MKRRTLFAVLGAAALLGTLLPTALAAGPKPDRTRPAAPEAVEGREARPADHPLDGLQDPEARALAAGRVRLA